MGREEHHGVRHAGADIVNDRDAAGAASTESPSGYRRWLRHVSVIAPFLGLLFIYLFFAVYELASDGSLDQFVILFSRFDIVAGQTTIVALAALGMTLIIISGGIDLSPGSSIALTSTVIAVWLRDGPLPSADWGFLSPLVALLLGIATAGLVGVVNGALITGLRIVPFIVTLGMMGIARGLAKLLGEEQRVNAPETWLNGLLSVDPGYAAFWRIPWGVVALVVFAVLAYFLLHYSVFGRHVFAIGSNESTARLCGVEVSRKKILIYGISGLLTGVAGVMQFSQLAVGDPTVAVGKELDIIASVVIGGGSLSGGKGSIAGTLIGAFVMGILRFGCDINGIPNYVQEIFIGLIIIAAVGIDQLRRR